MLTPGVDSVSGVETSEELGRVSLKLELVESEEAEEAEEAEVAEGELPDELVAHVTDNVRVVLDQA